MLSGNGRHRRPRQAPALLVAAGVTGSAIALPLLAASGASAADGTTWDRVADCESGGSWSADTGNGYYGGLQLTQDDWEKYGGLAFASSPDQASRSQQIAVAEKVLADRGPGVWPTCALLAGLTKDSGAAKVDTGVGGDSSSSSGSSGTSGSSGSSGSSDSSLTNDLGLSDSSQGSSQESSNSSGSSGSSTGHSQSSGSSAASGSSGTSRTNPSPSGSSTTKPDNSSKSGTSSEPGVSGSSPSATPESGDPDNSGQTGGSSALVDTGALGGGRHRGDTATEGATEDRTDSASGRHALHLDADASGAAGGSYTVRSGDSLASIADSLALDGGWRALYAANHDAIGTDPNRIVAGQTLDVPAETAQK
jgi:hypothetical protein